MTSLMHLVSRCLDFRTVRKLILVVLSEGKKKWRESMREIGKEKKRGGGNNEPENPSEVL